MLAATRPAVKKMRAAGQNDSGPGWSVVLRTIECKVHFSELGKAEGLKCQWSAILAVQDDYF